METLTQIIKSLKPGKVRLIRNYYKVQSNGEIKRRLDLFDLVRGGKVKDDAEACKTIYKCPPNSAFSHLKARLQRDILNILLLQDSSKRYDSEFSRAAFDSRRMLIEGQLLIGRGAYTAGVDILEKAKNLAEKYELYTESIAINNILRSHLGVRKGLKEFDKYNVAMMHSYELLNDSLKAEEYYLRIMVPNLFHLNREQHFKDYGQKVLDELEEAYHRTKSTNVGYHFYFIGIFLMQILQNNEKALKYAKEFLHLIETSPAIYSTTKMAGGYLQTAIILMQLNRPEEASQYALNAMRNFKKGMLNELQAIEVLFYAYYRAGDYKKAMDTYNKATEHAKYRANKLIPAKWDFFKANLYFSMGNFKEASELLIRYSELMRDRAGWLLGHKVLELMCMIELDDMYIMDYRAESFRKLLQRQKDENIARTKAILKILETFIKTGNSFKKTAEAEKERLALLREGAGDYAWDPIGFELVRFDTWFDSKLKSR